MNSAQLLRDSGRSGHKKSARIAATKIQAMPTQRIVRAILGSFIMGCRAWPVLRQGSISREFTYSSASGTGLVELDRLPEKLKEGQPLLALRAELVLAWFAFRPNVPLEFQHPADQPFLSHPEIRRIVGAKIGVAKITQHNSQCTKRLELGVPVHTLGKMLQFCAAMPAVPARGHLDGLQRLKANGAI
jgi:hypothetical protein